MSGLIHTLLRPRVAGFILFILACLLYLNTVPNSWAVDDGLIIHNSQSVRRGLSGLPAIFSGDFLESSTGDKLQTVAGSRYRPLTPAFYAVCAALFGRPATDTNGRPVTDAQGHLLKDLSAQTAFPHLMHGLNLILYALVCWVLYRLLLVLLKDRAQGPLLAFLAALFFTVHPLHTEAVANAKGLDEILALLFSLLSLRLAVLVVDSGNHRPLKIVGSACCLLLAILAKENALTFLAIIPFSLWFFRRQQGSRLLAACIPAAVAVVLYLGFRSAAVGSLSLVAPDGTNLMNNPFLVVAEGQQFTPLLPGSDVQVLQHPTLQSMVPMPADQRLATISFTWIQYLKLFVLPTDLSYDYYPRQIATRSFEDPVVWFSVLLHVGALIWSLLNLKRRRLAAYGFLFYFISFSIVFNLLFPVGTTMAERFLFMPSVGLCMARSF